MIELLVVIGIISAVASIGYMGIRRAQMRARDAERKRHLQVLKKAFEDYYNDNGCYPPQEGIDECNGAELDPYVRAIPCDPLSKQPYEYVPLANACQGYRVYTKLEVPDDEEIIKVGCDGATGCGHPLDAEYNYGIAVGTSVYYSE